MPKHRRRESIKSTFGGHIDPEKDDELMRNKTETENKILKILKLVKDEQEKNIMKDSTQESLVDLIEEFHQDYKSLYAHYDHLTGTLREKVNKKQGKRTLSFSSSDSDSDNSSRHHNSEKEEIENDIQKRETENLELSGLKKKLEAAIQEKDALHLECQTAFNKVQQTENMIEDLKFQAEALNNEKYTAIKNFEEARKANEELREIIHRLKCGKEASQLDLEAVRGELLIVKKQLEPLEKVAEVYCKQNSTEGENLSFSLKNFELLDEINKAKSKFQELACECNQLREKLAEKEKDSLHSKKSEMEIQKDEASGQMMSLTGQVNNMRQESDSLKNEKDHLEVWIESSEDIFDSRQQVEMARKIMDQERTLKEKEDAFNRLSEEHKQLQVTFLECKQNLQVAEKKMADITHQFHKGIESKNEKVGELVETIEDLRRDLEVKGDEVTTLVDYVRTVEVKLRLSNQRLRVTEQLLTENEESHKIKEEKLRKEHKFLQDNISTLSEATAALKKAQNKIVTDISKGINDTLAGMDTLTTKFEEDYGHIETCVYDILNEVLIVKNWVKETKSEKEQLDMEVIKLFREVECRREKESVLMEQTEELKLELQQNADEKEILIKGVKQLENKILKLQKKLNEQDVAVLELAKEKKEAIRQLSICIDYHCTRCNLLKDIISKVTARPIRITRESNSFCTFLT